MSGSTSILDSLTPVGASPSNAAASFPMVAPHPAPDGSGAMTNLSDEDYGRFTRGEKPPAAGAAPSDKGTTGKSTSVLDSLTPAEPTDAMKMASGTPGAGQSTWSGMGSQLGYGIREGIAGLANVPSAVPKAMTDLATEGYNWMTGRNAPSPMPQITPPPTPSPQGFGESAARAVGQGLPTLPLLGAGAAAEAPSLVASAVPALRAMGGAAAPVVAGQVGGEAAAQAVPAQYQDTARGVGNLVTAALTGASQQGAGSGARMVQRQAGIMGVGGKTSVAGTAPVTGAQADAAAAQVSSALGPQGVADLTKPATLPGVQDQLVPGSMPTTAQLVPTPGAVGLEKAHRVATPEPFMQRAQEQNRARVGAIGDLAQADASAGSVGQFFTQQLDAIDQLGQATTAAARTGVQTATEGLGGQQTTAAYGDQARTALQAAKEPVHAATQRLWQAVDPDGTWALESGATREAASKLKSEVSPTAQIDSQESGLLDRAAALPDVVKFSELGQMRADINAAMRRLSGSPGYDPNIRRLTILKQSIDQSIADGMNGTAATEAKAVASGTMTPEQTMMARLQSETEDFRARRSAAEVGARGNVGGSSAPTGRSGLAGIPGANRAESQATGRSGNPSRDQSLSSEAQPLVPNFDAEAAGRYRSAVAGTQAEKQRFGQGGVGQVLRPGKQGADFAVASGNVPGKIFTRGPTEPAEVKRFITAVGGVENAASIGRETLTNELRQSNIVKPDGTIDADGFARWQSKRSATLDQFPGLPEQFRTAEAAQRTLDDVTATHAAAVKDFERSAAGSFIRDDPMVAVRKAFASGNPADTFGQLVKAVRGNADAEAGLRRAVVDFITERMTSTAPAGTDASDFLKAATFRTWMRQNSGPLKVIFGGQGAQNLEAVAADLRRQAQGTTATVGPDTAQKLMSAKKVGLMQGSFHGTALAVIGEQVGEVLSHMLGGEGIAGKVIGATVGGGGYLIHALRQSGIANVNDLVREAMLHPNVARELLARVRPDGTVGPIAQRRIAAALQASLASQATRQTAGAAQGQRR